MPETMEQIRRYDVSEGKTVQIISRILGGVIVGVQANTTPFFSIMKTMKEAVYRN